MHYNMPANVYKWLNLLENARNLLVSSSETRHLNGFPKDSKSISINLSLALRIEEEAAALAVPGAQLLGRDP